jgi:hypothetical protein
MLEPAPTVVPEGTLERYGLMRPFPPTEEDPALSRAFRERLARAALYEHERRIEAELAPFFDWMVTRALAMARIPASPWWCTPLGWALTVWIVWRVIRDR